jgi:hypothetical protein
MMDRFNFYDIYGDVLPGTLLLGIFWLPFGLTTMSLPSSELSSTLLLLVLAYIAGHLMQMVALMVAPIMVLDTKDKKRTRSSVILDQDNTVFSNDFKKRLGKLIENAFDLKIMGAEEEAILDRETAFYQARSYLLLVKRGVRGAIRGTIRADARICLRILCGLRLPGGVGILFPLVGQLGRRGGLAHARGLDCRRARGHLDYLSIRVSASAE